MNVKSNKIQYEKAYIITKDKDENDLIDAKEYFESPDKFLSINPKISIGVSPNKRNYNLKKKKIKLFPHYKQRLSKKIVKIIYYYYPEILVILVLNY